MMNLITLGYVKSKLAIEHFLNDNRGVTAVEYAILAVAISAIVLALFGKSGTLGKALSHAMNVVSYNINQAGSSSAG